MSSCVVKIPEPDAALLLTPYGFQIYTLNDVRLVDGRDPDGVRVIIAYPSPAQLPRELVDPRSY